MSKSRAKRKRQQRARPAGTAPPGRVAANGAPAATKGAAASAKARAGRKPDAGAAEAKRGAGSAKARADAGGSKARGGAKARGRGTGPARAASVKRPEPIWAPFPLTEIGMGVGIVIFGVGYLTTSTWLVSVGALVLAVVVGELCVREHFAGFRSHALLIAALIVVTAHSLVFAVSGAFRGPVALAADLAIGGTLAWWLRGRFRAARERAGAH